MRAHGLGIAALLVIASAWMIGCSGDDGPIGPAGPTGPQGPPGDPGPGLVAIFSGRLTALPGAPQIIPAVIDTLNVPLTAVYVRSDASPNWYQVGSDATEFQDPRYYVTNAGIFLFADPFVWDEWRAVIVYEAAPVIPKQRENAPIASTRRRGIPPGIDSAAHSRVF